MTVTNFEASACQTPLDYAKASCETMMRKFQAEDLPPKGHFHYHQGVFLSGVYQTYCLCKNEEYFDYIKRWVDSCINEDGTLKLFDPGQLDDIQPGILFYPLMDLAETTGNKKDYECYKKILDALMEIILKFPKNKEGGFWHKDCFPDQMWLDDLYMAGPICAEYGARFNRPEFFDIVAEQALLMKEKTQDEKTGLLYHAYDSSQKESWSDQVTGCSSEFWGRSIGWVPVALLNDLDFIPENHPKRKELEDFVDSLLKTLCHYQSKEGRWYQVVNKGDCAGNWLENSCSCLYSAAIAKAVRKGLLSKEYLAYAKKGYEAVINSLKWEGGNKSMEKHIENQEWKTKEPIRKGKTITEKIIEAHLVSGVPIAGNEIDIRVDQTLTHDINAVMTYLAFEALEIDRVRTKCSVSYLDHNLLYADYKTPDDHIYLQSAAKKFGVWVSRPGNGICHTVHVSRFAIPGEVCVGGDSHTPHSGAIGMLSIGVGGMDVASAMAGVPLHIKMPQIVKVRLEGHLHPGVNAKEIILEMLRRESIRGGLGRIYEYQGPGAASLEVPQRATIANMGAEMGATASIFEADEQVHQFLKAQGREGDYRELRADLNAEYAQEIVINLDELEPLVACPNQPDQVRVLKDVEREPVQQVFIGSCTNASYADLAKAALVFKGHHVNENVSCVCGIASRQTYRELLRDGYLDMLVAAGVRLLEISCGPCCAIGQTPPTNGISVRTSNRNFKGRAGNPNAKIFLVSPESAAATAIKGTFADAAEIMGDEVSILGDVHEPQTYLRDDSMLLPPLDPAVAQKQTIVRGPNIKFLPVPDLLPETLQARVSLKGTDNISTDDITPASAEFSSMRSNIPLMSQYCYHRYDPEFAARAKAMGKSIIIAGENYGQGSSREHAAINPMYLGVTCVIAQSIARIHRGNLINHGILPLLFTNRSDYENTDLLDELEICNIRAQIDEGIVHVFNKTKGFEFQVKADLSEREKELIKEGGLLRFLKKQIETI